tara:strand:+ start:15266 stop:15718 length:453 start_codon:yes stop_codon:yes gene_type:complete
MLQQIFRPGISRLVICALGSFLISVGVVTDDSAKAVAALAIGAGAFIFSFFIERIVGNIEVGAGGFKFTVSEVTSQVSTPQSTSVQLPALTVGMKDGYPFFEFPGKSGKPVRMGMQRGDNYMLQFKLKDEATGITSDAALTLHADESLPN